MRVGNGHQLIFSVVNCSRAILQCSQVVRQYKLQSTQVLAVNKGAYGSDHPLNVALVPDVGHYVSCCPVGCSMTVSFSTHIIFYIHGTMVKSCHCM